MRRTLFFLKVFKIVTISAIVFSTVIFILLFTSINKNDLTSFVQNWVVFTCCYISYIICICLLWLLDTFFEEKSEKIKDEVVMLTPYEFAVLKNSFENFKGFLIHDNNESILCLVLLNLYQKNNINIIFKKNKYYFATAEFPRLVQGDFEKYLVSYLSSPKELSQIVNRNVKKELKQYISKIKENLRELGMIRSKSFRLFRKVIFGHLSFIGFLYSFLSLRISLTYIEKVASDWYYLSVFGFVFTLLTHRYIIYILNILLKRRNTYLDFLNTSLTSQGLKTLEAITNSWEENKTEEKVLFSYNVRGLNSIKFNVKLVHFVKAYEAYHKKKIEEESGGWS